MGRKVSRDKRLMTSCNMPPRYRTQPGQEYNNKNDDVLKWISECPELLMYVCDKLTQGGYIEYDSVSGTWQGVDYNGN